MIKWAGPPSWSVLLSVYASLSNIPIFIPHLGCPNNCVFCNQRTITGVGEFDYNSVKSEIDNALSTINGECDVEIAFFGGSFTGIDRDLMCNLLDIAYTYVISGAVKSIRCSTRPDYISEQILDILKSRGVKTVELGLQSCSDNVLYLTKRGHTKKDEEKACRMIVDAGLELVGQMMVGLPSSTLDDEIATAKFIAQSGATAARIYPTVVFNATELCNMTVSGEYVPLTGEDAVERSAVAYKILTDAGVDVIRLGLCASENLGDDAYYYAGPSHPALGELVENEIYYNILKEKFNSLGQIHNAYTVYVPRGDVSKAVGQKKRNKTRICNEFKISKLVFVEDDSLKAPDDLWVQERRMTECT